MFRNIFESNLSAGLSKFRIVKNLIVISLSFLFLYSEDDGLVSLQTTMNKDEGIGAISMAINFIAFAISSLLLTSFLVKKLGSKNGQILGTILMLPYCASNIYPMWITMLLAGVSRGVGVSLLWAAQGTYFNESSIMFCKFRKNGENSKYTSKMKPNHKNSVIDESVGTAKSDEQEIEQLSAFRLFGKIENNTITSSNSTRYH